MPGYFEGPSATMARSVAESSVHRDTSRVGLYLRGVYEAASLNQLNRLHINLERRITPVERQFLRDESITRMTAQEKWIAQARPLRSLIRRYGLWPEAEKEVRLAHVDWVLRWSRRIQMSDDPEPARWHRIVSTRGLALYSRNKTPGETPSLLIGWTGGAKLMMMPTPDFLQAARSFNGDVLLLWERGVDSFTKGISGISEDFPSSSRRLSQIVHGWGYHQIVNLGASAGALAALGSIWDLRPQRTVLLGALDPLGPRQAFNWEEFLTQSRQPTNRDVVERVHLFYGGLSVKDESRAQFISTALGVTATKVPDVNHGILYPLLKKRQLDAWFKAEINL